MLFIPDIVSNYIKTAEEYNRVKRNVKIFQFLYVRFCFDIQYLCIEIYA